MVRRFMVMETVWEVELEREGGGLRERYEATVTARGRDMGRGGGQERTMPLGSCSDLCGNCRQDCGKGTQKFVRMRKETSVPRDPDIKDDRDVDELVRRIEGNGPSADPKKQAKKARQKERKLQMKIEEDRQKEEEERKAREEEERVRREQEEREAEERRKAEEQKRMARKIKKKNKKQKDAEKKAAAEGGGSQVQNGSLSLPVPKPVVSSDTFGQQYQVGAGDNANAAAGESKKGKKKKNKNKNKNCEENQQEPCNFNQSNISAQPNPPLFINNIPPFSAPYNAPSSYGGSQPAQSSPVDVDTLNLPQGITITKLGVPSGTSESNGEVHRDTTSQQQDTQSGFHRDTIFYDDNDDIFSKKENEFEEVVNKNRRKRMRAAATKQPAETRDASNEHPTRESPNIGTGKNPTRRQFISDGKHTGKGTVDFGTPAFTKVVNPKVHIAQPDTVGIPARRRLSMPSPPITGVETVPAAPTVTIRPCLTTNREPMVSSADPPAISLTRLPVENKQMNIANQVNVATAQSVPAANFFKSSSSSSGQESAFSISRSVATNISKPIPIVLRNDPRPWNTKTPDSSRPSSEEDHHSYSLFHGRNVIQRPSSRTMTEMDPMLTSGSGTEHNAFQQNFFSPNVGEVRVINPNPNFTSGVGFNNLSSGSGIMPSLFDERSASNNMKPCSFSPTNTTMESMSFSKIQNPNPLSFFQTVPQQREPISRSFERQSPIGCPPNPSARDYFAPNMSGFGPPHPQGFSWGFNQEKQDVFCAQRNPAEDVIERLNQLRMNQSGMWPEQSDNSFAPAAPPGPPPNHNTTFNGSLYPKPPQQGNFRDWNCPRF